MYPARCIQPEALQESVLLNMNASVNRRWNLLSTVAMMLLIFRKNHCHMRCHWDNRDIVHTYYAFVSVLMTTSCIKHEITKFRPHPRIVQRHPSSGLRITNFTKPVPARLTVLVPNESLIRKQHPLPHSTLECLSCHGKCMRRRILYIIC